MRVIITAGHSYTVQTVGLNQSFRVATESVDGKPINVSGSHERWVLESDHMKIRDIAARIFDAEDMGAISTIKKELLTAFEELGEME